MSVQKQWYKRNATETAIKTTGSYWKKEDGKYSEKTSQNSEMTGKKGNYKYMYRSSMTMRKQSMKNILEPFNVQ